MRIARCARVDVEVDRARRPGRTRASFALEQLGRLRVAPELDQHRRRVDLEERQEAELAAVARGCCRPRRARPRAPPRRSRPSRARCRGWRTRAGSMVGSSAGWRSRATVAAARCPPPMFPSVARSTPRMLIARDSMVWSPIARALSMARSANGTDSPDASGEHQVRRQAGQHPRPDRRGRRPVEQVDGLLERRIEVAVSPASQAAPRRSRARARRSRSPSGSDLARVDEVDRLPRKVDGARGVADEGRRRTRRIEQVGEVAVGRPIGRGAQVPQLDRALVLARRLGVGEDGPRGVARLDGRRPAHGRIRARPSSDGRARRAGSPPPRHRGRAHGRSPARRPRGARAARTAAARRRRLPGPGRAGIGSARRADRGRRRGAARRRPRGAPSPSRPRTGRRRRRGRRARPVGRPPPRPRRVGPRVSGAADRRTSRTPRRVSGRRSRARGRIRRGDELLGEERVAVRAPRDRIDERGARRRADDAGQQLDELAALEPRQIEAFDPRLAFGLGQPGGQRVAAMELVRRGTCATMSSRSLARVARQEREQVTGRAVGPVQVLDDEQDRRSRRRAGPSRLSRPSKIRIWSHSGWLAEWQRSGP